MADQGVLFNVARLVGYVWDRISFIPWFILSNSAERLTLSNRQKSVPVNGNVAGEWRSGDSTEMMVTDYDGRKTMTEIFQLTVSKFRTLPCLGTRELLSEEDEVQPNGKIFKKAIYGEYIWETYGEVHEKVKNLAKGLSSFGATRVAIYMETRAHWMIAVQACFHHNIQAVTVYATLGEDAVSDALEESEVELIITSASLVDTKLTNILRNNHQIKTVVYAPYEKFHQKIVFKSTDHKLLRMDDVYEIGKSSQMEELAPPSAESVGVIMYTSGTSGKAKGVLITHKNMVAACSSISYRLKHMLEFTIKDRYIGYLPLAHILELMAENTMLFHGCAVGYSSTITLSDRSSRIKRGTKGDTSVLKPTFMAAVPEILERIRKGVMGNVERMNPVQKWLFKFAYYYKMKQVSIGRDTPILNALIFNKTSKILGGKMKAMLCGGAPLEEKTQRFTEICIRSPLIIGYGLTETTAACCVNDPTEYRSGRCGGVLDAARVKLVEWKEGGYSPYNTPYPQGEIWCGGNIVAEGYYKMPEKTAEDFHVDESGMRWFKSGDIGQFDDDGSMRIIDRKKDLVKLRHGEYIALGKIEASLKTSPLANNMCVFANSNELTCVAVVVGNEDALKKIVNNNNLSGDFSDWANSKPIKEAVMKSLVEAGKSAGVQRQSMPSNIFIETLQWTPETGLVTDALKLKRKALQEKYTSVVDELYKK